MTLLLSFKQPLHPLELDGEDFCFLQCKELLRIEKCSVVLGCH